MQRNPNGWFTEDRRPTHAVTGAHNGREHRRIKREQAEARNA
jgi:hypothetical protein